MPLRGTLNIGRARRLRGFNPQYPLERGFSEYIAWYRSLDSRGTPAVSEL